MCRRQPLRLWNKTLEFNNEKKNITYLVRLCPICNRNNGNRYVYSAINTTGYTRALKFMFIRRELGGTGTGCLSQFTYCGTVNP